MIRSRPRHWNSHGPGTRANLAPVRADSTLAYRVVWVLLPFAAGPALADALEPRSGAVRTLASVALWLGWAGVLAASLVPSTVSLTVVRTLTPVGAVAATWAAVEASRSLPDGVGVTTTLALASTAIASVVVMAPGIGDRFVDGSSYGPERRLPLRIPAPLLFGPLELAWSAALAGAVTGPLLLAAERWVAGGAALVIGVPVCVLAVRSMHTLARRWVVLVPGGMVIHDPLTVTESVLMPRTMIERLAPAEADTDAFDLTQRAAGLALEVTLREPLPVSLYTPRSRVPASATVGALLFTPTRPAAVLDAAVERRIPVG